MNAPPRYQGTIVSGPMVGAGVIALGSRRALAAWVGIPKGNLPSRARPKPIGNEAGWRLATLTAVVIALLAVYETAAVQGWLAGSNPHLNDRRPLDVLASGDVTAVMGAVQAARACVFA